MFSFRVVFAMIVVGGASAGWWAPPIQDMGIVRQVECSGDSLIASDGSTVSDVRVPGSSKCYDLFDRSACIHNSGFDLAVVLRTRWSTRTNTLQCLFTEFTLDSVRALDSFLYLYPVETLPPHFLLRLVDNICSETVPCFADALGVFITKREAIADAQQCPMIMGGGYDSERCREFAAFLRGGLASARLRIHARWCMARRNDPEKSPLC